MIATKTPAIDKAARIFHFIAGKGSATYSEIHQNVGLPQSTTSALLASLTTHAFLRQKNGRYYLGLIFYELGIKPFRILIFVNWLKSHSFFSVTGPVLPAIWAFWMVPPASIWRKKKARMRLSFAAGRENDFPCTVPPLGKCCWPGFRKTTLMLFYPQNTFLRLLPGQLQHVKR
ncbi:TPA: helix-turn-helix domain-containing protein [Escherichia coli]